MTAGEILDRIRSLYLSQFADALARLPDSGRTATAEPVLRNAQGQPVGVGPLELPMRVDLFHPHEGTISVDATRGIRFEPFEMPWGDRLCVTISPFPWDSCELTISGMPQDSDHALLRQWFMDWFDPDDQCPANAQGLYGVVHCLCDPKAVGGSVVVNVDFGSAPMDCFEELLDTLDRMGATAIRVGAPSD